METNKCKRCADRYNINLQHTCPLGEPNGTIMSANKEDWEVEFDRKFKNIHHPMIQAENVLQDTREIKDFISEQITLAKAEGAAEEKKRIVEELSKYTWGHYDPISAINKLK